MIRILHAIFEVAIFREYTCFTEILKDYLYNIPHHVATIFTKVIKSNFEFRFREICRLLNGEKEFRVLSNTNCKIVSQSEECCDSYGAK